MLDPALVPESGGTAFGWSGEKGGKVSPSDGKVFEMAREAGNGREGRGMGAGKAGRYGSHGFSGQAFVGAGRDAARVHILATLSTRPSMSVTRTASPICNSSSA